MIRERPHVELPAMSVPSRGALFEQATSLHIGGATWAVGFPAKPDSSVPLVMAVAASSAGVRPDPLNGTLEAR